MRRIWNRFTLLDFATEDNNGEMPQMAPIWCALLALVLWAAWITAQWLVSQP